ncbi:hypothetical protein [Flavobacterium sangjuense]|uniref:Uncharacterized protein n=1 Tax=Flavobacterium sangjuense TaxID=2518177 RepID=A0A4V1CC58_9FLAO|nr:hypothetical protein [Flavobacterium sangjuense]QBZ98334.1 hypothetical protein GS03_01839 [Flavobacterium sangjuense]
METTRKIVLIILCLVVLSSFTVINRECPECDKLERLELKALKANSIGKQYTYDLSGLKNCNKTSIKYLGIVRTNTGKQYKILTSFFVFKTHVDICHGTSNIKIYDIKNKFFGYYYVGYPDNLPDYLKNNKLLYSTNSADCNLRKTRVIDCSKGLPKQFFINCSKNGGDIYKFSRGD